MDKPSAYAAVAAVSICYIDFNRESTTISAKFLITEETKAELQYLLLQFFPSLRNAAQGEFK